MSPRIRGFVAAGSAFSTHRASRNVVWNLLGGISAGVMVVFATPWYVERLGLEGYGIVGLWLVLQVMMGLLDMGMGVTVVKAFAGASPGAEGTTYRRDLMRTLEALYWSISLVVSVALCLCAGLIASRWLNTSALPSQTIATSMRLIALALFFQFPSALYVNGLAGLHAHGRMNALQTMGNLMRYGGGAAVLIWRPDLIAFFLTQVIAAVPQTLATRHVLWSMLDSPEARPVAIRPKLITPMWRYSLGMAVSSIGAVLMANADRITISALLPTSELGKYSVAFAGVGLLQFGIQPFYRVYFPRFAELFASGEFERLRGEYMRSCQLAAVVLIPLGISGATFAPQLIETWLGRQDMTIASVFRVLLVAVTCTGLMWLPAALQQASGWTRLHASMIFGALFVGTPLMVLAIDRFGVTGAATVWLLHGVSGVTLELWLMHRRLLVGELGHWYRTVIATPLLVSLPLAALSRWGAPEGLGRWGGGAWAAGTGLIAIGLAVLLLRSSPTGAGARTL